jgi:Arc/MetJ-type ribon-helix-helix transcriptional regulator
MAKRVSVNWKITPRLKAWIEAHVELGEFPDSGACVEDAIRRFHEMNGDEDVDTLLNEARRSGKPRPVREEDWRRLRDDLRRFSEAHKRVSTRRRSA